MRSFLVLILFIAFAAGARAEDCDNAMDEAAMNACADQSFKKADEDLNAVYQKLRDRKKDDEDAARLLIAAERAWVAFRDAECQFDAADSLGGSIYPMIYANCLERLTRARVKQFDRHLRCEEGEAACSEPVTAMR